MTLEAMDDAPKTEGEGDKKIIHVYPLVKVSFPSVFVCMFSLRAPINYLFFVKSIRFKTRKAFRHE